MMPQELADEHRGRIPEALSYLGTFVLVLVFGAILAIVILIVGRGRE